MSSTPKYDLIDRVLGGTLTKKLTDWRAEGSSYEAIARKLEADHDITVSTATVCRWVNALPETVA